MWVVAGILLGLVVLVSLVGLHTGPHTHFFAGVLGAIAAVWLIIMALDGNSAPTLYALLGADVVVSAGAATFAWKGVTSRSLPSIAKGRHPAPGDEVTVVQSLAPEGVVRLRGEEWTAKSLNGPVEKGHRAQVVEVEGVRLLVWNTDENAPSILDWHDPGADESQARKDPA